MQAIGNRQSAIDDIALPACSHPGYSLKQMLVFRLETYSEDLLSNLLDCIEEAALSVATRFEVSFSEARTVLLEAVAEVNLHHQRICISLPAGRGPIGDIVSLRSP